MGTTRLLLTSGLIFLISHLLHPGLQKTSVDARSGATPLATRKSIPEGVSLEISGEVRAKYVLTSKELRRYATTRIRTREVSQSGAILGAYIYYGIPVYNIMEGIRPEKKDKSAFQRPLDMLVTFLSEKGEKSTFSYGELTMTDDQHPVTLAFYRKPLLPSKNPSQYRKNRYKGNLQGLRLICPREVTDARYLDNVVKIIFTIPESNQSLLPKVRKGIKCTSPRVICIDGKSVKPGSFGYIPLFPIQNWFRIGHGMGIKSDHLVNSKGYPLHWFLKNNFPKCTEKDFFLFVACDGYRAILSGREIFTTPQGLQMFLIPESEGEKAEKSISLGVVSDFFLDRNLWGLSHIERITHL